MEKILLTTLFFVPVAVFAVDMPLRVHAVEAHLYLQNSGALSRVIGPEMALWNTIIGEGDAGEPSTSTLVDVIVEGAPGSFSARSEVKLVVSNSRTGKVKYRFTSHVGVLSRSGVSHIPFWLKETGCEPLKLVATVGNTKAETDVSFACGE